VRATVHGEAAWTQESFAAQAAEKFLLSHSLLGALLFVVDKPYVFSQVPWLAETLLTHSALIWLLSCVSPQV